MMFQSFIVAEAPHYDVRSHLIIYIYAILTRNIWSVLDIGFQW